jgi:FkbM family methyltransferase
MMDVKGIISSWRAIFRNSKKKRSTKGNPFGRMAVRDRFADLQERTKRESPVIVDGGAYKGGMTDLFLRQYSSPTVYLFEPVPSLARDLRTKYSGMKNIFIHEKALGAKTETVRFNILRNKVASSVLRPSKILQGYHGDKMDTLETLDVEQVRLDEILDEKIDILKLDLQGYELEALRGCEGLLGRTKSITTEIEFVPLYEEQVVFGELDTFLRRSGFQLLNLYELWTHPDGQLTAGDAVYMNKRYLK